MTTYTDNLEEEANSNKDYSEENLLKVVTLFNKSFGEAMDSFITEFGYTGKIDDINSKVAYIRKRFSDASIDPPRGIKNWFIEDKGIERDNAFKICFAFNLNIDQTNDFFKKVYLEKSFDCHTIKEAIYYYCMRNNLSFNEALNLIKSAPKDSKGSLGPLDSKKEVLYTGTIIEAIKSCKNETDLLAYFSENINQFGYKNVTATKNIQRLWNEITELSQKEIILRNGFSKKLDETVSDEAKSTWDIYLQILGLDEEKLPDQQVADRSIMTTLDGNKILNRFALNCFPDRDSIDLVRNGNLPFYEKIRKILILVVFYTYWVKFSISKKESYPFPDPADADRCICEINKYLLESNYPDLYYGNPYDWIFLWASRGNDYPLATFRNFIYSLRAVKSEENQADDIPSGTC